MSNEKGWVKSIFEIPTNSGFQAEASIFRFPKAFLGWGRVGRSSVDLRQERSPNMGSRVAREGLGEGFPGTGGVGREGSKPSRLLQAPASQKRFDGARHRF